MIFFFYKYVIVQFRSSVRLKFPTSQTANGTDRLLTRLDAVPLSLNLATGAQRDSH